MEMTIEDIRKQKISKEGLDGLIANINSERVCKVIDDRVIGMTSEKCFDMGLLRAIAVIREYFEVLEDGNEL